MCLRRTWLTCPCCLYEGRQIVLLLDEIREKEWLNKLEEQNLPVSVRMILILNPKESKYPLNLP